MAGRNVAVFGTYRRPDDAEEAVGALIIRGFPSETISALIPENLATRTHRPEPVPLGAEAARHVIEREIALGTVGLLDDVTAISVPDVGMLIGAGPLMNALAVPDALSVAAAFEEAGAPAQAAKRYEKALRRRAIVSVNCADAEWAARAEQVLTRTGAERLSSNEEPVEQPKARHGGALSL